MNIFHKILKDVKSGIMVIKNFNEMFFINEEAKEILEIKEESYKELPEMLRDIVEKKEEIERYEIRRHEQIIGIGIHIIEEEGGIYSVAIFKDISNIKQRQDDDRRREKLALLGEISVSIAHELRNPLNLIKGFSQLMLESEDIGFIKENLNIVMSESNRLNSLVSELLDYTKKEELNLEKIGLLGYTKELIKSLNLGEIVEIKCEEEASILADRGKLIQIFLNMIKNGIEAIEGKEDGIFKIEIKKENRESKVYFISNGEVSSELNLEKIFDPFVTTKTNGTGLGLAISKKLVEAQNGVIIVSENEYKGLTFKMIFREEENIIIE